jgi:hypothetical protein
MAMSKSRINTNVQFVSEEWYFNYSLLSTSSSAIINPTRPPPQNHMESMTDMQEFTNPDMSRLGRLR